jgi:hypothetical protein
MNQEDKKRFARYKKGYIENENDINNYDTSNSNSNNKNKLGIVNKIDINMNVLITDIMSNKNNTKK